MPSIKLKTDPVPVPRTHVRLDKLQLLGLVDGVPNSILVSLAAGSVVDSTFESTELFPMGPLPGDALYAKDPEAFDRVITAVIEYLIETGTVDGTKE